MKKRQKIGISKTCFVLSVGSFVAKIWLRRPEIFIQIQKVIKYGKMPKEWHFENMFYFVCRTLQRYDSANFGPTLKKTFFSHWWGGGRTSFKPACLGWPSIKKTSICGIFLEYKFKKKSLFYEGEIGFIEKIPSSRRIWYFF